MTMPGLKSWRHVPRTGRENQKDKAYGSYPEKQEREPVAYIKQTNDKQASDSWI